MKRYNKIYDAKTFKNVREVLDNAVELYPDNKAFIIKEKKGKDIEYKNITYKEFKEQINSLGTALIDLGLKDKRVAIISKNRYEWALTYFTVLNGVGITVPLDKGLKEEEIISCLVRSKADSIVFEKEYLETMKKAKANKNVKIKEYICMDDIEEEGFRNISDVIKNGEKLLKDGNKNYVGAEIDEEKMATIIFTSGTTSMSKAVMLSHKNIASNITDMMYVEKVYDTDVNMAFLPFHHTFGSTGVLFFLANGATNVFCDGLKYVQKNLVEYKVSVFVCVPLLIEAMYKKILAEVEKQGKMKIVKTGTKISKFLLKFGIDIRRKLFKEIIEKLGGNLRFIISGASALDKNVAEGFNNFGILTVQGYGLTETSPVLTAENEKTMKLGSVGIPMYSVDVKIDNPDENGIGEIVAKGPNVMLGYYENEEATNEVIKVDKEGNRWFHTGDLGYIDKDGFVFITGRKKNVIVLKNGKNIFPEELEALVTNLPYVAENMVYGKTKGDDLVVSIKVVYNEEYVKEKYGEISEEDLKDIIWKDIKEINNKLPTYKHIKNLVITKEPMIKTTTAKIKRFEEEKNL
ncbi:MAG: AMP-binding protein [Clostridia bacterium]|nr:AMP-binding protein [Clostridia bacterium]